MSAIIDRLLLRVGPVWMAFFSLLLIGGVGLLDHLTGHELSFQIFYLLPVALSAWYVGVRQARAMALAAALTWLAADWSAGRFYSEEWIGYWNALVRLLLFLLIARLVEAARTRLRSEQALSDFDSITRLPNQRAFHLQLTLEQARLTRYRSPFTVAYIHIQGFKQMRATMGDELGDELLEGIAARLLEATRASDHLARLDEAGFAVLFPREDWSESEPILRRLGEMLEESVESGDWPVTIRVGALTFGHGAGSREEMNRELDQMVADVRRAREEEIIHRRWHFSATTRRSEHRGCVD